MKWPGLLIIFAGSGCITELRAAQIAKGEYLRDVVFVDGAVQPGLITCEGDPLSAAVFEEPSAFRVTVSIREECLGLPMLDGEGRYLVSRGGALLSSSTGANDRPRAKQQPH